MGQGVSKKSYTSSDIQTMMNTIVKNETTNITNIINETITNTTTNIINNNTSSVNLSQACSNALIADSITQTGTNNTIDFGQNCNEEVTYNACLNLLNDPAQMTSLANQSGTDVSNALSNNTSIQESVTALAQIQNLQEKQGGLTGVLSQIASTLPSIIGGLTGSNSKNISKVLNAVNINISNITTNENNIKNTIITNIVTNIKNTNAATCNYTASIGNLISTKSISQSGSDLKLNIQQTASLKTVITCILSNTNLTKLQQSLTNNNIASVANTTANTNNAVASTVGKASIESKTTLVPDTFFSSSTLMWVCCILCCILLVGFGGYFLINSMNS